MSLRTKSAVECYRYSIPLINIEDCSFGIPNNKYVVWSWSCDSFKLFFYTCQRTETTADCLWETSMLRLYDLCQVWLGSFDELIKIIPPYARILHFQQHAIYALIKLHVTSQQKLEIDIWKSGKSSDQTYSVSSSMDRDKIATKWKLFMDNNRCELWISSFLVSNLCLIFIVYRIECSKQKEFLNWTKSDRWKLKLLGFFHFMNEYHHTWAVAHFKRCLLIIYLTFVIVYVPMWKIFDSQLSRVSLIVTDCEI